MAQFNFDTITPEQALAWQPADSMVFATGFAHLMRVAFLADQAAISITGGRTVTFGPGIFGEGDLAFQVGGFAFIGTPGPDVLGGGPGDDAFFGGAGADLFNGEAANDLLQGNQGFDTLSGGPGNDIVFGGQDEDVINLGVGADERNFTNGNRGNDTITAAHGGDTILGGQGADQIVGGAGADLIFGNLGDDLIDAGPAPDIILGDDGYDIMRGGTEGDVFVFPPGSSVIDFQLSDRILDWAPEDRIDLSVVGGYAELEATPPAPPVPPSPGPYGYAPTMDGYAAAPVDDFVVARDMAAAALANNPALNIVAAQAGADVLVLVDTNADHLADMGIILSNTNLGAISDGNFI
ncbi:calcium-binding protein [Phenylobacterium sp. LjRoot219]|uniref:calcium-binding protein n=1 Tax=Phenylobacterium sp. LjRoot219 TaxID=3342283 RepID=UPI003ECC3319